jgi:uncharacterized protein YqiB (DUF1249 family)
MQKVLSTNVYIMVHSLVRDQIVFQFTVSIIQEAIYNFYTTFIRIALYLNTASSTENPFAYVRMHNRQMMTLCARQQTFMGQCKYDFTQSLAGSLVDRKIII